MLAFRLIKRRSRLAVASRSIEKADKRVSSMSADPSSFASAAKCVSRHLHLSLRVDFQSRVIRGKVALTLEVLEERLSSLVSRRRVRPAPR